MTRYPKFSRLARDGARWHLSARILPRVNMPEAIYGPRCPSTLTTTSCTWRAEIKSGLLR